MNRPVVIAVDVGGTKVKVGAVDVGPSGAGEALATALQIATPRVAPAAFYDAVAQLVQRVRAAAGSTGRRVLPVVAVAHPGRFLPDGRLARGTTPNLGAAPNEFDGLAPAEELARRLGGDVIAENDAVAQMRFGLGSLLRDPTLRPSLLGETVIYLGPGTGMGGGVARVSAEGEVEAVTDGHLFDLQVPGWGDGTLTAEELFTGEAVARRVKEANSRLPVPIEPATAEHVDRLLLDPGAAAAQRSEAARIADEQGESLSRIIETVHAGRIVKVRLEASGDGRMRRHMDEPDRAWSAADCAVVRGARRFILGGSMGCSRGLGARVRARALSALRQRGQTEVSLIQIPVAPADAGLLGVLQAIPTATIRRLSQAA